MTEFRSGATPNGGWVHIPATLGQVEPAVETLYGHLTRRGSPVNCFEFGLLCFEGLSNAVRHGCANDPERLVTASVEIAGDAVILTISDDGPGFDWRAHTAASPGDGATHGRGLWILQQYGDEVRFNDAGNQVTIVKHNQHRSAPTPHPAEQPFAHCGAIPKGREPA